MKIEAENIEEGWKKTMSYILEKGDSIVDNEGRRFKEVINLILEIKNPLDAPDEAINILNSFKKWVYPNKKELKRMVFEKDPSGIYEFSYGQRIFNFVNEKDQIDGWVIPLLKEDQNTRRAVVSLYNPITDSDLSVNAVPSLLSLHFLIRDGKLNLNFFIRSNEFFIGWPANIFQLVSLYEYVANKLDGEKLKKGKITTIASSAHIYEENFDYVNEVLKK